MPINGKLIAWDEYQLRCKLDSATGTVGGSGYGVQAATCRATVETKYQVPGSINRGFYLDIISRFGTPTTIWTFSAPDLGWSYTNTTGSSTATSEMILVLEDVILYALGVGFLGFRLVWGNAYLTVDTVTVATFGAGSLDNYILNPSAVPLIGIPANVTGGCISAPIPTEPPNAGIYSASASCTAIGGWRFIEGGSTYALPVSVSVLSPPALACTVSATTLSPSGTDCWTMTCPASASMSQSGSPTFGEFEATLASTSALAVPNLTRAIRRFNSSDYAALWYRFALPQCKRTATATCFSGTDALNGTLTSATPSTDDVFPAQSAIVSTVTNSAHAIEDTMGYTVRAPYTVYAYAIDGQGDPSDLTKASWTYYQNVKQSYFYGAEAPGAGAVNYLYANDPAADYVSYNASPHWSYAYYQEPWEVAGSPTSGTGYWLQIGEQWIYQAALPGGEQLQKRNTIISCPLNDGVYTGLLDSSWASLRWLGVSRWQVDDFTLPTSKVLDSDSEDSWSAKGASLSFGATITVTPD